MRELINGRTPEEIKHVAEWNCYSCGGLECDDCPYLDACTVENRDRAVPDALALIERLESERDAALAKVPRWISVEDELPPRERNILAVNGHGHIKVLAFWKKEEKRWTWIEGSRFTHWNDITHWMPLPEPPKKKTT